MYIIAKIAQKCLRTKLRGVSFLGFCAIYNRGKYRFGGLCSLKCFVIISSGKVLERHHLLLLSLQPLEAANNDVGRLASASIGINGLTRCETRTINTQT
jgi:hypothetical protein